ncbi:MAG: hypothetical protein N3A68_00710 [Bacteroidia bacterium]|nr:hypothetical protein [Bacteroidia bacterium]GIV23605.1 MAG: hypothetical protein KatS3mg025_1264 [Bacteroidia bacterium]
MATPEENVPTFTFPPAYYRWLEVVRRYPMFDVWRAGVLCTVRITYLLEPNGRERDVFLHRYRWRDQFPATYLPLGYDVFGNLLLWDMREGQVYLHWRGKSQSEPVKVADTLEDLCEKLYYCPIY